MTYSIVARDPETGALGVAVQSHYFSVASVVAWAEAGVGAVATQAMVEASYGPLGLDLMRAGIAPEAALRALTSADDGARRRQVAFVDAKGNAAAYTGDQCIPHAGYRTTENVSVQANMMERDTVPDAMMRVYTSATGSLTDRMLAALDAAEAEGGDIRGRQSAAILVVARESSGRPWNDRLYDLRVEDHPEPNVELRRLVELQRLYRRRRAPAVMADDALREFDATQSITRGNPELLFWNAHVLASQGDVDGARALLQRCIEIDRRWLDLLLRLAEVDMGPDAAILERVIEGL